MAGSDTVTAPTAQPGSTVIVAIMRVTVTGPSPCVFPPMLSQQQDGQVAQQPRARSRGTAAEPVALTAAEASGRRAAEQGGHDVLTSSAERAPAWTAARSRSS